MPRFFNAIHLENTNIQGLILSVIVVVLAWMLAAILRRFALRYIDQAEARYRTAKAINRSITVITLIIIAAIWTPDIGVLLAVLAVLGTGLAIAMRDAVLGFVGWLDIVFREPYQEGDRIEINGVKGDVIEIRMLHTTLMEVGNWVDGDQSTGRLMHIPNGWIFSHALQNYSHGFSFIWNELSVVVTFRSDWEAAREIMLSFARESTEIIEEQASRQLRAMSRNYLVHYSLLTPFVYVRIIDNGVRLTLRHLCEVRKRRGATHAFTVSILQAFADHDQIELAYPAHHVSSMEGRQFGPISDESPS
jgi:small-conductance mechanosensitive channel